LDQNNYVERLNVDDNSAKSFNSSNQFENILHNYFDDSNKIIFKSVSN